MSVSDRLRDKVVIVTGGVSGIGEGIADRLREEGARVIAADISCETDMGEGVLRHHVDVSDQQSVRALVAATVDAFGHLDAVVHSAGTGAEVPFLDTTQEQFERIIRINLLGSFLVVQEAARVMVPRRQGSIVNIASVSGMIGNGGRSAYGTSKAGLIGLTRITAAELAQHNVRVNAVSPGPVDTPLVQRVHSEATRRDWNARVALGRYGTVDEIAPAAAFLASDDSTYITGEVIAVDGGFLARGIGVTAG